MTKLPENFELDRYGLHVRLVREDDAAYIVRLRTDPKLGRYIHHTDPDVGKQIAWLKEYKKREQQGLDYYFVFESPKGCPCGLLRIYDIADDYFTIGSWVFDMNAPKGAAILADIITKEIGFELFPEKKVHWDNMKENLNVLRHTRTYHPTLIRETETQMFFEGTHVDFEKYKQMYLRMYITN